VWALLVVFIEPLIDHTSSFGNRIERPAIETTILEDAVETLVMSVLPRAARIDEMSLDAALFKPRGDLFAMSSGPLSLFKQAGAPRCENSSSSTRTTSPAGIERAQ
jgi:hypothetical protein